MLKLIYHNILFIHIYISIHKEYLSFEILGNYDWVIKNENMHKFIDRKLQHRYQIHLLYIPMYNFTKYTITIENLIIFYLGSFKSFVRFTSHKIFQRQEVLLLLFDDNRVKMARKPGKK